MLKVYLDDKAGTCEIEMEGNLMALLADVAHLIRSIYCALLGTKPLLADGFRYILGRVVGNEASPVWQAEGEQVDAVAVQIPSDILDSFRGGKE